MWPLRSVWFGLQWCSWFQAKLFLPLLFSLSGHLVRWSWSSWVLPSHSCTACLSTKSSRSHRSPSPMAGSSSCPSSRKESWTTACTAHWSTLSSPSSSSHAGYCSGIFFSGSKNGVGDLRATSMWAGPGSAPHPWMSSSWRLMMMGRGEMYWSQVCFMDYQPSWLKGKVAFYEERLDCGFFNERLKHLLPVWGSGKTVYRLHWMGSFGFI